MMKLFLFVCVLLSGMPSALAQSPRVAGRSPNTDDTIRFVVISDRTNGPTPEWGNAIAEINRLAPDFVLSVGDFIQGFAKENEEATIAKQWKEIDEIISQLDAPFYFCPGNHDVGTDHQREVYIRRHGVDGKTYYSFDHKNAHFIILDSDAVNRDKRFAAEQLEWLKQDIAKAAGARHVFLFYHHPYITEDYNDVIALLPKDRTTIFHGHTHWMNFRLTSDIPTYILSSSGAATPAGDPAAQHTYAYVVLNEDKPIVSIIPNGSLKTGDYAQKMGQLRTMLRETDALAELAETGGELTLTYRNTLESPLIIDLAIDHAGWHVRPQNRSVTIPAAEIGIVRFDLTPEADNAVRPSLRERFSGSGEVLYERAREIPLFPTTGLEKLEAFELDGRADEWQNVPHIELGDRKQLFQNEVAWKGPTDGSARVRAAISGDLLALLFEVRDDQLLPAEKRYPWEHDGLEICWDVRPQVQAERSEGTGQLAISPSKEGPARQVIWFTAGNRTMVDAPEGVRTFTRFTDTGYVAEVAIPVDRLGLSGGTLAQGSIRLTVALNDLDPDGVLKRMSLTGNDFWRNTRGYHRFSR